jgi:hypothetical protein
MSKVFYIDRGGSLRRARVVGRDGDSVKLLTGPKTAVPITKMPADRVISPEEVCRLYNMMLNDQAKPLPQAEALAK